MNHTITFHITAYWNLKAHPHSCDVSCRTTTQTSLNDLLWVGPTIQTELYMLLLRFRLSLNWIKLMVNFIIFFGELLQMQIFSHTSSTMWHMALPQLHNNHAYVKWHLNFLFKVFQFAFYVGRYVFLPALNCFNSNSTEWTFAHPPVPSSSNSF